MALIDQNGTFFITNLENDKIEVTITKDTIQEALHLPKGMINLIGKVTKREQEEIFHMKLDQPRMFANMRDIVVVAPLHIFVEIFRFQKLKCYTTPSSN